MIRKFILYTCKNTKGYKKKQADDFPFQKSKARFQVFDGFIVLVVHFFLLIAENNYHIQSFPDK